MVQWQLTAFLPRGALCAVICGRCLDSTLNHQSLLGYIRSSEKRREVNGGKSWLLGFNESTMGLKKIVAKPWCDLCAETDGGKIRRHTVRFKTLEIKLRKGLIDYLNGSFVSLTGAHALIKNRKEVTNKVVHKLRSALKRILVQTAIVCTPLFYQVKEISKVDQSYHATWRNSFLLLNCK